MQCKFRTVCYSLLGVLLLAVTGCNKRSTAQTAFYFWKTSLDLDTAQLALLKHTAGNHLYLRFFDIVWNEQLNRAMPEAILTVKQNIKGLRICPVIYITNKTFEHTSPAQADALAVKANRLADHLAGEYQISYQQIQIDCDWTEGTKNSYFSFLKAFKKYNRRQLEATVRLHQIKYPERTGVPPADKGLLMFYNMGKLSADLHARNSIYNAEDAEKYISFLPHYHLPLDIALPLFSWTVQIREGKMIQIYGKISKKELSDIHNFQPLEQNNVYSAKKSFYLEGIYIKSGDLFKFEGVDPESLNTAAKQVSKYLAPLEKRNIIYYEISSVNLSAFDAKDIQEVSAHF